MKLLFLLQWYPPDLRVPARRWGYLVSALQERGVFCTVISAGDGQYIEYTGNSGERIIRVGISNEKKIVNTVKSIGKRRSLPIRLTKKLFLKFLPPVFLNSSVKEWFKQRDSSPDLLEIAGNSDYIISSYGPMGPFVLGWWLSKKTGKPWIADIRDSFESKETNTISLYDKVMNRISEKYMLRHAKIRITVGVSLAKYLSEKYKLKFHAIYNGWVDSDRLERAENAETKSHFIYYAGSIYSHRLPALSIVLKAIKNYPAMKLRIRLINDNTNGEMAKLIDKENPGQVELLPPVKQEIVKSELSQALCAIVIEDISDTDLLRNGTVTGKLLSLLASGVPGIAVSSESGEIRNLTKKIDGWYGVNSVEQFIEALKEIESRKDRSSNLDKLKAYKMDEQSLRLMELINMPD